MPVQVPRVRELRFASRASETRDVVLAEKVLAMRVRGFERFAPVRAAMPLLRVTKSRGSRGSRNAVALQRVIITRRLVHKLDSASITREVRLSRVNGRVSLQQMTAVKCLAAVRARMSGIFIVGFEMLAQILDNREGLVARAARVGLAFVPMHTSFVTA